ncbi:ATPase family protein associated with various cellular activities (AAA) [Prosthecobacter fusiformis]|uniref:ATPase family protein associated with various cellular activities (AAA) n=1 Tax=Prosthecobacter fusiformis TaxID=48464 RepID=A0A4R7RYX7_9BACT|nr:DNA repair ATPase [Prosthecobacter fusiformis]TDU71061.1 ATPase family protein associated with various cellular activities (AAA) [Prosthecobacter fusiformis]
MTDPVSTPQAPSAKLEAGAYEVIRQRLDKHGAELQRRLEALNADRKAEFGGIDTALLATTRLTTDNNCVPQDMVAIGPKRFLFGYNVLLGLRTQMHVADVFGVYDFQAEDHSFHPNKADLLADKNFAEDFDYLYRYYKNASFLKFHRIGPHLYMGMQVGRDTTEIKAFKWLVDDDDGTLQYLGNRFDHEFIFPTHQEFEWKRARREMYRHGLHPHISIEDRVFVETVGGDLTVKVENNTETGRGIYSEPVDNADQTLDDAEVHYAIVGNLILMKVLPYQEKTWRYLVFNERTREAHRIDSIAESCVLLPDGHGIIFPHGYVLQTGEVKRFDTGLPPMRFERRIVAANGEDTLFVFSHLESGSYLLLSYNLISQGVATPIICHGYSLFPSGELILFQGDAEPRKHHVVQSWRTPFVTADESPHTKSQTFLSKIGNAEIVRCMAECNGVLTLLAKDDSFSGLYVELARAAGDIADSYFWVDREEAHQLKESLLEIKTTAEAALGEFEKVSRMRKAAADQTETLQAEVNKNLSAATGSAPDNILAYVHLLATLRGLRGQIIALRDVRYVDLETITRMDTGVAEATDKLSEKCVAFLLLPEALDPYRKQITEQQSRVPTLNKVTDAQEVEEALAKSSSELEMLTGIVSSLKIKDATETTRIIEAISTLFAQLNQVRSVLKNRRNDLAKVEGSAQFQAQLSLLNQSVLNYLEVATTPEKCDESLTRVMVQIEELESRFSDFDEYAAELTTKREEIHNAFEARRLSLADARNRRAQSLGQSAERILTSVRNRLAAFAKPEEVHSWLAGDAMVAKLRDLIEELRKLGDSVRADELQTKLKTLQQDSLKEIRDKAELFADGGDLIQLGKHKFSVNRQPLELTILPREEGLAFHLTGTRYFEKLVQPELEALKPVWDQPVVSENAEVYRAEYLAWKFLQTGGEFSPQAIHDFMAQRYHEGYTKGVHDHDAALILQPLQEMQKALGLLTHSPLVRGLALMVWHAWEDAEEKQALAARMTAKGRMRDLLGQTSVEVNPALAQRVATDCQRLTTIPVIQGSSSSSLHTAVAACLTDELQHLNGKHPALPFTRFTSAVELLRSFRKELTVKRAAKDFDDSLDALASQPWLAFEIALDWLRALHADVETGILVEAAALLVLKDQPPAALPPSPASQATLTGFTGAHPRIHDGKMELDYHEFTSRLRRYEQSVVPDYERFQKLKHDLAQERRTQLRLDQFKAGVLSSFVRNRLMDQVYLPIIGANLAKQIGAVGNDTRTDRMGLLLLISPPGYGKTTLMEYVASRLGITLVKINGPAIGHKVTSLDPAEAPNASAREEVEKLNLSLEMGDNVMIYLDDIQHTNPEFLQKFISLCDGTRRIEGVFQGKARTYDLRGRKVAVVMAGNPYTEVGGKFQVPDMLANRADTYNLGDILGGHEAAFKDSYIENCLTSNPALARVAARSHKDAMAALKIAMTGNREGIEFEGNQSAEDVNDCVAVMEKLLKVREVILRVNQEYIRSAAMEDAYRTEPPFKLQGSYRNMNKISEKIQPLMTAAEVHSIIEDHYRGESQTLSQSAEANLLKWREINDLASDADKARWTEIKRTFGRNLLAGGSGENDPVSRITGQMSAFTAGLEKIEQAVSHPTLSDVSIAHLQKIIEGLRAVPVTVEIKVQPVEKHEEDDLPVDVQSSVKQSG